MAHSQKHSLGDTANHDTTTLSALNALITDDNIASESQITILSAAITGESL